MEKREGKGERCYRYARTAGDWRRTSRVKRTGEGPVWNKPQLKGNRRAQTQYVRSNGQPNKASSKTKDATGVKFQAEGDACSTGLGGVGR
ncbi:unnamed protein product [Linum trigynum]|uniref:Uncharacterized protein n=1 Tax=Linum trigynum TaxID=586398 RepID=A0AAV2FQS2_9ROSI